MITERGGKVVFLSDTYEGKKHDKKIADEKGYQFPSDSTLWQDTGFQGYAPEGVKIQQPKKKPRGGELTATEKEENQVMSKIRVEVEPPETHCYNPEICLIKAREGERWREKGRVVRGKSNFFYVFLFCTISDNAIACISKFKGRDSSIPSH